MTCHVDKELPDVVVMVEVDARVAVGARGAVPLALGEEVEAVGAVALQHRRLRQQVVPTFLQSWTIMTESPTSHSQAMLSLSIVRCRPLRTSGATKEGAGVLALATVCQARNRTRTMTLPNCSSPMSRIQWI